MALDDRPGIAQAAPAADDADAEPHGGAAAGRGLPPPDVSSRHRGWGGVTVDIYKNVPAGDTAWLPLEDDVVVTRLAAAVSAMPPRAARSPLSHASHVSVHPKGVRSVARGEGSGMLVVSHVPRQLLLEAAASPAAHTSLRHSGGRRDMFMSHMSMLLAAEAERPAHPAQRLIWQGLSHALAAHLVNRFDHGDVSQPAAATTAPAAGGLSRWQERRAKELLRGALNEPISMESLAAACRLSRGHFSKAFKRTTGLTPHRWLQALRIERAKRLLLHSALPISEIATACGFADQSHFTRVFAQALGMAPGGWQRLHR
jgi:AraC-like DNA-binding protein